MALPVDGSRIEQIVTLGRVLLISPVIRLFTYERAHINKGAR